MMSIRKCYILLMLLLFGVCSAYSYDLCNASCTDIGIDRPKGSAQVVENKAVIGGVICPSMRLMMNLKLKM